MDKKYKITLDRKNCIGCNACEAICPENWKVLNDGKSVFKKELLSEEEYPHNKEAEESCPVNVIHISEVSKGNS